MSERSGTKAPAEEQILSWQGVGMKADMHLV